jgi:uncharacterized protein
MKKISRRQLLLALGGAGGALVGSRLLAPYLLSTFPTLKLSAATRDFVKRCYAGLDKSKIWDTHAHVLGMGAGGTGCEINPDMIDLWNPFKRLQYEVYTQVAGIAEPRSADQDFLKKLLLLHRASNPAGKLVLLAFDRFVDETGQEHSELTPFFVPNEYVFKIVAQNKDTVACASIHPYRKDAVQRLDRAVARGAVAVKWLPNAMGIDPSSKLCDRFYDRLAHHRIPLITHAGNEQAVDSRHMDGLGNPLRLRRPLERGVRVVIAHMASFGVDVDIESPDKVQRSSFELALRLFDDPNYTKNLYADLSALTFLNRDAQTIRTVLRRTDLHPRLVNGSDYPLPGIDILVSTRWLVYHDLISQQDRKILNELFEINPLLFDFAVKRSLRLNEDDKKSGLSNIVFESARVFDRAEV